MKTSTHPAFSPGTAALLRCAPDAAHLELEANEVDAVVGAALSRLLARGDQSAGALFGSVDSVYRLEALMCALGQALRVPVKLRAGACDAKGTMHPGNGLGAILGTLNNQVEPYTGRGALAVVSRGRELGTLVRSPRLEARRWVETRRDGTTKERRQRFLRSNLYVSAPALRRWYRHPQLAPLIAELGRIAPGAWRAAARLVRGSRGYWGAICRSRAEVAAAKARVSGAARRRAAFERYRARISGVQIRKTKREKSPESMIEGSEAWAPRGAAGAGRGEGRVESDVLDRSTDRPSDPSQGSFRDRLAALGLDLSSWGADAPTCGLRPRLDGRADVREPARGSAADGAFPWRRRT